jgi:hypothetical protein
MASRGPSSVRSPIDLQPFGIGWHLESSQFSRFDKLLLFSAPACKRLYVKAGEVVRSAADRGSRLAPRPARLPPAKVPQAVIGVAEFAFTHKLSAVGAIVE